MSDENEKVAIYNLEKVKDAKEKMIPDREIYDISDFFKIFGDSTRLQILLVLESSELSVGDICAVLNMSKSSVSHQLRFLKDNKIVKYRKQGKNVLYSLDDYHVSIIIETAREHLREK